MNTWHGVSQWQALDEDSAAGMARLREKDAEIDAGIDSISRTIDNLSSIGSAMKDEVIYLNSVPTPIQKCMTCLKCILYINLCLTGTTSSIRTLRLTWKFSEMYLHKILCVVSISVNGGMCSCLLQVVNQNQKLEKIEGNMQKTTEKQTVVNARQRYLLK